MSDMKNVIDALAEKLNIPKSQAKETFDFIFEEIDKAIQEDGEFAIAGFGKFVAKARPSRKARNPQTGATIMTEPKVVLKFKIAKATKEKYSKMFKHFDKMNK